MSHFTVLVDLKDVSESIDEIMEPFWEQTENPEYLEFVKEDDDGYYTNPNAVWDWYQIGGRWAYSFLVKENYKEPIKTELSWASDPNPPKAPKGYKWVSAAEKGAIEWELMKQLSIKEATEMFYKYQKAFNTQSLEDLEPPFYAITEEGINNWGSTVYYKDETLEDFLSRRSLSSEDKYEFIPYGFVNNGEYHSRGDMGWWAISSNEKDENAWNKEVNDYLDSLDDSQIIVLLDCHI